MSGINPINHPSVSEIWQRQLKDSDTNGDGKISKAEFTAQASKMQKSSGGPAVNAEEIFAKIDASNDGNIDESEFKASAKKMEQGQAGPQSAGGPPPGGPPPARGAKGAGGAGATTASNEVYDKKDTNKDGIVDSMEALTYALAHPEESTNSTNNTAEASGYTNKGTATSYSDTASQQLDIAV